MKKVPLILATLVLLVLTAATIDLNNLIAYGSQTHPAYITKNNTPGNNRISDKGATLGRVLFYDKQLSVNNTIACGSCHQQQFAFGDTATLSVGFNGGLTGRHSMRLVNARFGNETKFFWDERATSLENQTTQPIQNHVEMGFSNTNGDPGLDSLIRKMQTISYYPQLFQFVYGSTEITETKIQNALAQFIRSIQSYDSKYDAGRAQVSSDNIDFPNFTTEENEGKILFMSAPAARNGGAGCNGCHSAPEFDIVPNTLNNGIIEDATDTTVFDLTNTRSPSLRDVVNTNGIPNGPFMHNGKVKSLLQVINHYNNIPAIPLNTNLDPKLLRPGGQGQSLNLTTDQKNALIAFLRTLSGTDIYTNARWSNPFDANGNLTLIPLTTGLGQTYASAGISVYPNPATECITLQLPEGDFLLSIYNMKGKLMKQSTVSNNQTQLLSDLTNGLYILNISGITTPQQFTQKLYKSN
ncbi:MAG: cytochrome c peroxidase [Bacteroidota bacterium]